MKLRNLVLVGLLVSSVSSVSIHAKDAHHAVQGISAEAALKEIKEGHQRFLDGKPRHPAESQEVRRELASGQKPHTIVLSCSDSRVPPELIFDQGFGQVFTVRVAGNFLNPATVASMEYAVEHLGSKLILVMGHTSCGAVKAAVTTPVGQSAGSKDLDQLVSALRPNLTTRAPASTKPNEDKTFYSYVRANTLAVAHDLYVRSAIIRGKVDSKEVQILPAIYDLESSKVEFVK